MFLPVWEENWDWVRWCWLTVARSTLCFCSWGVSSHSHPLLSVCCLSFAPSLLCLCAQTDTSITFFLFCIFSAILTHFTFILRVGLVSLEILTAAHFRHTHTSYYIVSMAYTHTSLLPGPSGLHWGQICVLWQFVFPKPGWIYPLWWILLMLVCVCACG